MDLSLLATLKERLIHAKEFSKVWEYFLDHFGEDSAFMGMGERTHDAFIESLILQSAKQAGVKNVSAHNILLTGLPEYHFMHGGLFANGHMINVLYFEDIFMGSIMICSLGSDQTTTMRFTGRKIADPTKPSMN